MTFVAVKKDKPVCLMSGCSDVLHINGIGGFGYNWLEKYSACPKTVPPTEWSIDCLPKSGYLRIFCGSRKMRAGVACSSFEVFSLPKEEVK